jgi:hypothetical protein
VKDQLTSWGISAGSGLTAALAGAPWWAGLLAIFAMRVLLLASRRMDYREVYRLARLANSGTVKGYGGIEWTASYLFRS